jgi:hypothetical protein
MAVATAGNGIYSMKRKTFVRTIAMAVCGCRKHQIPETKTQNQMNIDRIETSPFAAITIIKGWDAMTESLAKETLPERTKQDDDVGEMMFMAMLDKLVEYFCSAPKDYIAKYFLISNFDYVLAYYKSPEKLFGLLQPAKEDVELFYGVHESFFYYRIQDSYVQCQIIHRGRWFQPPFLNMFAWNLMVVYLGWLTQPKYNAKPKVLEKANSYKVVLNEHLDKEDTGRLWTYARVFLESKWCGPIEDSLYSKVAAWVTAV